MQPTPIAPGDQFGLLTVLSEASPDSGGRRWLCGCECGGEKVTYGHRLRGGLVKSCGCLRTRGPVRHGHARKGNESALYRVWKGMHSRCYIPSSSSWEWYGALGVSVCPRWHGPDGFENFVADMGPRPDDPPGWESSRPYWSLDRIDPNGNYSPENCRWSAPSTQSANRKPGSETCKKGHPFDGIRKKSGGGIQRTCSACQRDYARKARARRRAGTD